MEELYRKLPNGRYEKVGLGFNETLKDGIWLVQTNKNSRSISSLLWKLGDLKKISDITTYSGLFANEHKLSDYLFRLIDENSDEYKEAKTILGNYLTGSVTLNNISINDFISLLLRKIGQELDKNDEIDLNKLSYEFRKNYSPINLTDSKISFLNEFINFVESKNITIKKL